MDRTSAEAPARRAHVSGAAAAPAAGAAELRGVLRNAGFLLLAYGLPRGLTFAAAVVAARVLGTAGFGAYGTAAAFAVILSVLASLGMTPLLVREMARAPARAPALLADAHRIKLAAGLLMLGALLTLGHAVLGFPAPVLAASLLLGLGYAVGAFVENLAAYFQAVERMHVWTQASALLGVVWGGLGAALVLLTSSLVWFCAAPAVGQLAALAWLAARAPRRARPGGVSAPGDLPGLLRGTVPFAAAAVLLTLYYKLDVLLLAHWRAEDEVGVYAAAYRFVDVLQALVVVAVMAAYPRLARVAARAAGPRRWEGTRLAETAVLAAVPIAGALWLAREPVVGWLYGQGYAAAAPVLALLAPLLPTLALNLVGGYVLSSRGRMARVAALYAAATVVSVGLNALLIPAHGARGAALAMLLSESLLAGGFVLLLRAEAAAPGVRALVAGAGAAVLCGLTGLLAPAGLGAPLYLAAVLLWYRRARVVPAGGWAVLRLALRPSGRASAAARHGAGPEAAP